MIVLAAVVLLCSTSAFSKGKDKDKGMYLFGVSTSLTDSIVYVTDVQRFDKIGMTEFDFSKTISRYSIQLQNFVSVMMSTKFQTGFTFYDSNKKKIEKEKKKVVNKFEKKGKMVIVTVPLEDFKYEFVPLVVDEE